ncbi:preprotein translocase subunit SecE [Halobacteriovorax marinus]|uniref:Preprotein translocase subunit n=1 Tax=Halobacteriovorax marinus (strain ATCC BAA-682 / DSM 15412 / SJ) TaxID=862908 RepID=E1X0N6_HALMS|nr:preprotein translocase subunit SecE [Halobacteriovorax marinus]ATH09326.1 preprotein translocase subunit SecE [Halobacteriovorax marinus]CBW28062.1 putative preprotein translocase subunit [Halobacteriovorax marinus SJ]
MSFIRVEDGKKWINAFVAIISILAGFVMIRFVGQLGEWFDLEAKISNFLAVSQGLGIVVGLGTFVGILKNKNASTHMQEVYSELVKVVWPDKDSVLKMTVGLVITVSIISGIFVLIDFLFRKVLELLY